MVAAWTANSAADENWVCQHCLCCSSSSENDARYNVPIYANFLWMANLLNVSIFHVQKDLSIIFVSLYSLWATIMLLHHFDFVCALILGYPCMHFSCHWHKIRISHRMTQISNTQRNPCFQNISIIYENDYCTYYKGHTYWNQQIQDNFHSEHMKIISPPPPTPKKGVAGVGCLPVYLNRWPQNQDWTPVVFLM